VCREQRRPARTARQRVCHLVNRVFSPSYFRQYPVCLSDLLLQESGGFTFYDYVLFRPGHFPPQHFPHRTPVLRVPYGQGPEVMSAHEKLGRLRHLPGVKAFPDPKMSLPPQG
ncbi:uncharacterized protein METZ01_LOCUS63119, partial [marine metagenome]